MKYRIYRLMMWLTATTPALRAYRAAERALRQTDAEDPSYNVVEFECERAWQALSTAEKHHAIVCARRAGYTA